MNRTRVKICGLTRTQDVDTAVEAGADALGLVFTPRSKRLVDLETARELVARIPAFVCRVGLFMDQDAAEVKVTILAPIETDEWNLRDISPQARKLHGQYLEVLDENPTADRKR